MTKTTITGRDTEPDDDTYVRLPDRSLPAAVIALTRLAAGLALTRSSTSTDTGRETRP
ncbi:hypothetical protein [Streptomyces aidingensis]|nr:hypothetical protein [Streptomyces aidingensis]